MKAEIIPSERIQQKILLIRGQKVILDRDLADFYRVTTFNLNKAVARNKDRFPPDFMFQLKAKETRALAEDEEVAADHGGRRSMPYAFTEQGVAMLSAILKSKRAIAISVQIVRSFVKLREWLLSNDVLTRRLKTLESKTDEHSKAILYIIQELQKPVSPKTKRIGF